MTDRHDQEDGSIPESTAFIPESTLLPESVAQSFQDMDNGDGSPIPESTAEMVDDGGLSKAGAGENKGGFVKKNLPFLIVGALALGLGGTFVVSKMNASAAREAAVVQQQQAQKAAADKKKAEEARLKKEAEEAAAAEKAAKEKAEAEAAEKAAAEAEAAEQENAQAEPAPVVQAQPAAQVAAQPVQDAKNQPVAGNQAAMLQDHEVRITRLEQGLKGGAAGTSASSGKDAAGKDGTAAKPKPKRLTAEQKAKLEEARRLKKEKAEALEREHQAKLSNARASKIVMIRHDLVWLDAGAGTVTYKLGDTVPGVGKISSIDEEKKEVKLGKYTIR